MSQVKKKIILYLQIYITIFTYVLYILIENFEKKTNYCITSILGSLPVINKTNILLVTLNNKEMWFYECSKKCLILLLW